MELLESGFVRPREARHGVKLAGDILGTRKRVNGDGPGLLAPDKALASLGRNSSIAHANAPAALAPGVARHNRARIQRARAIWLNNALPSKWLIPRESPPSIGATMALPGETEAGNAEKQPC